jgi:isoleucyl-tRNA synthetase
VISAGQTGDHCASRLKYYPHSWRSKSPSFSAIHPSGSSRWIKTSRRGTTLRHRALSAIKVTLGVGAGRTHHRDDREPPPADLARGFGACRIAVFVKESHSVDILQDRTSSCASSRRSTRGRRCLGTSRARASVSRQARQRFWKKVDDILDVWFDTAHACLVLEDLKHF